MQGGVCKCPHHKMVPLGIVVIAALFFLQAINVLSMSFVGIAWPIVLGIIGFMKLSESKCKCC